MKPTQVTNTLFMVTPINFTYNVETSSSNSFQRQTKELNTQELALNESNNYIKLLKENNVKVISVLDTLIPHTPDSVFPNNWFTTHSDGSLVLYPMCAHNRRLERKQEFIDAIKKNFNVKRIVDLTHYELENEFLEGTGSMVLDRINKIVYACLSPRTSIKVLDEFCEKLGYKKIIFNSYDRNDNLIYHTNVMMSIGTDYAIVCLDSIKDIEQKELLIQSLKDTKKKIIDITYDQLDHFLGNVLEIKNINDERLLVMSTTAYNALNKDQLDYLNSICKIITPSIPCIEINGGGSARCMIAEIFNE